MTGGVAWLRAEQGQSSVELVALAPCVLLVALAVMTLLEAHAASGRSAAAAHAGAIALLQREDPREAARAALGAQAQQGATIEVAGRRVTVTVRPASALPFLDGMLTATASTDAGPEPAP